jgi:RimJ/RimL family protein N-acetyltransferase
MTVLETERLVLRSPEPGDAKELAMALNDFEIAKNLAVVPYPYAVNDAYAFIGRVADGLTKGTDHVFVIRQKGDGTLAGCCGLHLKDGAYELGYWIAKPCWRHGFAGEAAFRLVAFAFDDLGADRLTAGWYHDNGVSGRVLAKLGFKAVRVEKQLCAARGHDVLCNRTMLTREDFGRRKAA